MHQWSSQIICDFVWDLASTLGPLMYARLRAQHKELLPYVALMWAKNRTTCQILHPENVNCDPHEERQTVPDAFCLSRLDLPLVCWMPILFACLQRWLGHPGKLAWPAHAKPGMSKTARMGQQFQPARRGWQDRPSWPAVSTSRP